MEYYFLRSLDVCQFFLSIIHNIQNLHAKYARYIQCRENRKCINILALFKVLFVYCMGGIYKTRVGVKSRIGYFRVKQIVSIYKITY